MSSKFVLYDLPSADGKSPWSLNPWKVRMVLNIKGLDYETEWVEFPDVQSKLGSLGIPPNAEELKNMKPYTIPVLKFDDSTIIMDSGLIVEEIEKRHPTPDLKIHSRFREPASNAVGSVLRPLMPLWLPNVPDQILSDRAGKWFIEDREKSFGKSLDDVRAGFKEESWEEPEKAMKEIAALLKENEGPFFEGDEVSYADVIFVTMLYFLYMINKKAFDRILSIDPAISKVYDACGKWFKRDD